MNTQILRASLITVSSCLWSSAALGGAYIGADGNNPNVVTHPSNYTGAGGNVTVRVCISPSSSVIGDLVTPVQNVINTMNQQQPTTGNLVFGGANDIPSNAVDAESALLHEAGHCIGLAHPNLATESGLPASQRDYTKSSTGNNGSYDLNDGPDNVLGSADDLRGDDVNLHWFRIANNNPFTIDSPVDSTTYSRNLGLLPGGSYAANAARAVGALLGVSNTEAVMQQGQSFDEAQRTLGHDDVATLGYGRSGVDEVAGTGDDYTTTLVYQGVTTSGCDLTVSVDANTGFASCSVGLAFVGGGDHFRITSGTVRLNNATNWYYNQTPNGGPANSPPAIVSIVNQVVAEGDVLNIAISAGDPDAGDTLAFSTANLPAFCTLFDSGNRTADIVCTPGTMDEGTYPILVTVTDNGVPPLDDSTSFDLVVTPDGLDEVVVCSLPAVAIPDNAPAGVSDELVVGNGTATIVDLDVSVGIAHTYVGDLAVALEHVTTGTSVVVIDRPGVPASSFGCSGDNVEAILDDEGTDGPVEDACGAATAIGGTFTPNEPLSAFDGEPVNGTWRLTVSDSVDQDTGTLGDWCVSARVQAIPDTDADGDGVFDSVDNCQTVANPAQIDSDGDGYGNLCDADLNNDCIVNAGDLGLLRSRFFSPDADADFNSDGVVNAADLGILKQAFFAAPGPSALTQSCDDT